MYRYASGVHFRMLRYGFQYFGAIGTPGADFVRNTCRIGAKASTFDVQMQCGCRAYLVRNTCRCEPWIRHWTCTAGRGNIPYCIRDHVRISTECERMYPNAYSKYMYPRSCTQQRLRFPSEHPVNPHPRASRWGRCVLYSRELSVDSIL